jgi:hypothetical protein
MTLTTQKLEMHCHMMGGRETWQTCFDKAYQVTVKNVEIKFCIAKKQLSADTQYFGHIFTHAHTHTHTHTHISEAAVIPTCSKPPNISVVSIAELMDNTRSSCPNSWESRCTVLVFPLPAGPTYQKIIVCSQWKKIYHNQTIIKE